MNSKYNWRKENSKESSEAYPAKKGNNYTQCYMIKNEITMIPQNQIQNIYKKRPINTSQNYSNQNKNEMNISKTKMEKNNEYKLKKIIQNIHNILNNVNNNLEKYHGIDYFLSNIDDNIFNENSHDNINKQFDLILKIYKKYQYKDIINNENALSTPYNRKKEETKSIFKDDKESKINTYLLNNFNKSNIIINNNKTSQSKEITKYLIANSQNRKKSACVKILSGKTNFNKNESSLNEKKNNNIENDDIYTKYSNISKNQEINNNNNQKCNNDSNNNNLSSKDNIGRKRSVDNRKIKINKRNKYINSLL